MTLAWVIAASSLGVAGAGCGGDAATDAGVVDAFVDAGIDAGIDAGLVLPEPPALLSEAGLYASGVEGALAAGVRAYEVRHPLWSDGLEKRRYVLLPEGGAIDTSNPDHWLLPVGSRVFKEFWLDGRRLETRMLWRAGDTGDALADWVYVSYVERADGSDADASPMGVADTLGTFHDVPAQDDCLNCHRGARGFVLGVSTRQLAADDFAAWQEAGLLPTDAPFAEVPGDARVAAALGYLHGNCGHCHNDTHPLAGARPMRLWLPVEVEDAASAPALLTTRDAPANHDIDGTTRLVVPGDPDASQVLERMLLRDELAMPPTGTERVDEVGSAAVRAWISAL